MNENARADQSDQVDQIISQWALQRPEVDTSALQISARILLLSRLLNDCCDEALSELGLTLWQYDVLAALRRSGQPYRLSPTDLARAVTLSTAAMTNRLDRLEAKGWIKREDDPADRRGLLIQLTPSGCELIDRALPLRVATDKRSLDSLSKESQGELAKLLRQVLISSANRKQSGKATAGTSKLASKRQKQNA